MDLGTWQYGLKKTNVEGPESNFRKKTIPEKRFFLGGSLKSGYLIRREKPQSRVFMADCKTKPQSKHLGGGEKGKGKTP